MSKTSQVVIGFTGFQRDSHARAIHEYLRASAGVSRTLEEIVRATEDVAKIRTQDPWANARGHLRYWTDKKAYVKSSQGWVINPRGVRFEPREYVD
jgi:hypothetical protein